MTQSGRFMDCMVQRVSTEDLWFLSVTICDIVVLAPYLCSQKISCTQVADINVR